MRLSLFQLALLLAAMAIAAAWRPYWLLAGWAVALLVFPTAQAVVGGIPLYTYDLLAAELPPSRAAAVVAQLTGRRKAEIYARGIRAPVADAGNEGDG